ncbi:MAG TPA: sulfotransferase [Steroidobacteraceae bacterium]
MNASAAGQAASTVELDVRRVRDLLKNRRFAEGLKASKSLAAQVPENRDVLYFMARSERHLDRVPEAFITLERLEQHHPRFSRLYEERGHCFVTQKKASPAIEAFLTAVNINPALPESWSMLEGLYRMVGSTENAAMAAAHVAALKRLPPEVVQATALFSDGDFDPAENIVRSFLLQQGNHVEAMRLLARIGIERDVLDDAELLLEAVLDMEPGYLAARVDYARVLLERHKHSRACEQLEQLLQLDPTNRQYMTMHATALVGLGDHERAVAIYRDLLAHAPQAADLHLSIAHSLKTLGRRDESVTAYHAAAAARPDFGDAYWSLANLKTYRFTDRQIDQMRSATADSTPLEDRYHLCFALGKAYEDRGEYAESWHYYRCGNALKRSESQYRPEIIETNTSKQIAVCTPEFFASRKGVGAHHKDPIFIVGLPRAGSTLLEQILASHSLVEGTQELADIQRTVLELQGRDSNVDDPRYPKALEALSAEDFMRLGQRYLNDTRVYRTNKPYFIDKMPNNFRHIGLIHLMLPNARIIDARREPMACCFSNLKQLFANGQEFTYSIEDIARYYRTYLDLMAHWDEVLPGRILRVEHEAVIDDLEGNVRRMLDFCGLEFETACVEFHKTARSVRTASSEQVRQPIFRAGLDQWKHYDRWLSPLKDALGDALVRYRTG